MKKQGQKTEVHFRVELTGVQKATIAVAVLFIVLIGGVTLGTETIRIGALGLFLQLIGSIVLGLGIIKTNDELGDLAEHHEQFNKQRLISHLTKDRFFIVFGLFLVVVGLLMQILSQRGL